MRHKLVTLFVATIVITVAWSGLQAPTAVAGDPPSCPPGTTPAAAGDGWICVPAVGPGNDGGEQPGGGTEGTSGGGGPATCTGNIDANGDGTGDGNQENPCTSDLGVWFSDYGCYANQATLPPDAIEWRDNDPSEGSIWLCNNPLDGDPLYFFVPSGQSPMLVDPAVLAQRALDRMQLATPTVHMAPQPPLLTYVGLETWLWMDPGQWDTLSLTVTAGPTSVTVTAEPARATWDLTAGSTTCTSPGRAWVRGMSSSEQTDCSYTFDQVSDSQPEDAFPVTATLTYQVDWVCNGACLTPDGTLGEVDGVPANAAIRVGERQSVVIR